MTDTYTLGSYAMIGAMIRKLPDHYDMSLNPPDMTAVIVALGAAAGFYEWSEEDRDRAMSVFSSIGETLGIEGI